MSEPAGEYITLVIRLQATSGDGWSVQVESDETAITLPLLPTTFVVRLWRSADTGVLRGTIQLHGTDYSAPIQSNDRIEALLRAWLVTTQQ